MPSSAPLLDCAGAALRAKSGQLLHIAEYTARGPRLLLLGGFQPLLELILGEAALLSGQIRILGQSPDALLSLGVARICAGNGALPEATTSIAFLEESARLAGLSRRAARMRAQELCAEFGLSGLSSCDPNQLRRFEKVALALAASTIGDPKLLILVDVFCPTDEGPRNYVRAALEHACHGRRLIAFAAPQQAGYYDRRALGEVDEVWHAERDQAAPAGLSPATLPKRFLVTATRCADEFFAALGAQGCQVLPCGPATLLFTWLPVAAQPGVKRAVITLPSKGQSQWVTDSAAQTGATLIELVRL